MTIKKKARVPGFGKTKQQKKWTPLPNVIHVNFFLSGKQEYLILLTINCVCKHFTKR